MIDPGTTIAPDRVEVRLDEAAFPRDAVYGAAYAFIDRCYVRLDRAGDGRLAIVLRAKAPGKLDGETLATELRDELFAQAFRLRLAEDGQELTAAIVAGAFGAGASSGPAEPSLDDLLAGPDDAFDDPLGIAQSWEEKYAKKAAKGEQGP